MVCLSWGSWSVNGPRSLPSFHMSLQCCRHYLQVQWKAAQQRNSEVNFCVHGSKSLYHIVGAPIWAANAPRSLCESRSKLGSRLFDRCSIGVETDDLQLLLGFWPCLIDRESQLSHVQRFPTTHNSLVLVFCLCSPRVLKTARLA